MKVTEVDMQTLNRLELLADKDLPLPIIAGVLGIPAATVERFLFGEQGEED